MKKKKTKAKPNKQVPVKMNKEVQAAIQKKANLHCEGNLSKWMRYASLHFNPHPGEIIKG